MTTSSPSLAFFQGTLPHPSGCSRFFLGICPTSSVRNLLKNLLMAFVMFLSEQDYLLSFLSFPLSFKHPGRPSVRRTTSALSQARKIIYPFCFFCQYLFLSFFYFFSRKNFRRAVVSAQRNIRYCISFFLSILFFTFF